MDGLSYEALTVLWNANIGLHYRRRSASALTLRGNLLELDSAARDKDKPGAAGAQLPGYFCTDSARSSCY